MFWEDTDLENRKILVGVSGGVDSSVCVDLLKKQGFEVFGAVINFNGHSENAIEDAHKVCSHLDIPICVIDARESFEKNVVQPFCQSYISGRTPNPCVVCNPLVKLKSLCDKADEMGIFYVATGHYAQIVQQDGIFYVKKAANNAKDQSYMLYRLPQDILKRLVLPLGQYEKPEIRSMAQQLELFNADKPDSQEICFIPDGNHGAFIEARGYKIKKGFFISPEGRKLAQHKGIHNYTIGQRKGLGVALGRPAFVKEICENGNILLGYAGEEFFSKVVLSQPVYTQNRCFEKGDEFVVKIRSAARGDVAVTEESDEEKIVLNFPAPVRAAAKGQSVVIYKDDIVVGGGFIADAVPYNAEKKD
ncbi:MAG: tRNA 2-thiouridine(34) synthase MnmA [Oscillospiraceae bacterium]|nr:tRNA 2-thiouridine(34) synthase MnmA [Oscillospiraceae bacterium]